MRGGLSVSRGSVMLEIEVLQTAASFATASTHASRQYVAIRKPLSTLRPVVPGAEAGATPQ